MPSPATETINEVDFCAKMASAANAILATFRDKSPFAEARVEGMGSSKSKRARKDLRFYGKHGEIKLTGEVKLPGGVGAFDSDEVKDAHDKAEHAGVQYFFTWDVNRFALWDRSQWQKPLLERRVNVWHLRLDLTSPQEVARPETLDHIEKRFLPNLIRDLAEIVSGHRRDWALPPDEVFLRSLESHLDWPVSLLRQYMHAEAASSRKFDLNLQAWLASQDRVFARSDPALWREAVDNAARTLAYIWTNRFIFYKVLRFRWPDLPKLELGPSIKTGEKARERLTTLFRKAAELSGDYESLLFPEEHDWANDLAFAPDGSVDAWRGFLKNIEDVDFSKVPSDIVGLIFQRLISPEERHRFGQHFTGPDAVDLINAFCIRNADASVLDPSCGSGSFLVRAYYRKKAMDTRTHGLYAGLVLVCGTAEHRRTLLNARQRLREWLSTNAEVLENQRVALLGQPPDFGDVIAAREAILGLTRAAHTGVAAGVNSATERVCQYLTLARELRPELERLEAAKLIEGGRLQLATLAFEAFNSARQAALEQVLTRVSSKVLEYYTMLHEPPGGGGVSECRDVHLLPTGRAARGGVSLAVKFFDKDNCDPKGFLSEGHLDSLGLCIYLATVKLFNPPASLLVLDDVLTSVDQGHRTRVRDLLVREFVDYQIVITTHDGYWFDVLQKGIQAAGRAGTWRFERIARWTLQTGPESAKHENTWAYIDSQLAPTADPETYRYMGGPLRVVLEDFLKRTAEKLEVKVRFKIDGRYTAGDFDAAGSAGKIRTALLGHTPTETALIETALMRTFNPQLLNALSHDNPQRLEVPRTEVADFVAGLKELTRRCEAARAIRGVA